MSFLADRLLIRPVVAAYPFDVHDAYCKTALETEAQLLAAFLGATASFHQEQFHFSMLGEGLENYVFPQLV